MTTNVHVEAIYHTDPDFIEFVFNDNTRQAVDEYIQHLLSVAEHVRQSGKLEEPILFVVDVSQSGIYPLQYSTRELAKYLPQLEDVPVVHFAYLVDNSQDRFIIEGFQYSSAIRAKDTRRVFNIDQRQPAIDWLLSKKA